MVAPVMYRLPRASAAAAATELLPEPPVVLTHCKAGAKSAAAAVHENARIKGTNVCLRKGSSLCELVRILTANKASESQRPRIGTDADAFSIAEFISWMDLRRLRSSWNMAEFRIIPILGAGVVLLRL